MPMRQPLRTPPNPSRVPECNRSPASRTSRKRPWHSSTLVKSSISQPVCFLLVLWYPAYQEYVPEFITTTVAHLYVQVLALLPAELAQQAAAVVETSIAARQNEGTGAVSIVISLLLALALYLLWNAVRNRDRGLTLGAMVLLLMAVAWTWDADLLTWAFAAGATWCAIRERTDLQWEVAQLRRRSWLTRLGRPQIR